MATETKKANSLITAKVLEETFEVTLKLPVGITFTVLDTGEVGLDLRKVSAANLAYAVVHGFGQRIPDAAAITTTDKDGTVIPKDERTRIKYEKMNEVCVHYESGSVEWAMKARGDGAGARSITLEAIARVKGCTYDEAKAKVEAHAEVHKIDSKKALAELRKSAKVQEAIAAIRAEREAAPDERVDEILNNL